MLDSLTEGFSSIVKGIRGQSRLTEQNIAETIEAIRTTLIDADVALDVADDFVAKVKERSLGHKVLNSLTPGQAFIGLVQEELVSLLGQEAAPVIAPGNDPVAVMVCGLQGTGKTTSAAKIALNLKKGKKRVLVASTDVKRPAAIDQLRILCGQVKVDFHEPEGEAGAEDRARLAVEAAKQTLHDYVLIDTAGRNVLDTEMMEEIKSISRTVCPSETLLVIDATQGQEALTVARKFDDALALSGICITKLDSDARGGAAMSACAVLGRPVKFIGVGEKLEDLQLFDPARMASRILGMGDIVSLVEAAKAGMEEKKLEKLERRMRKKKTAGLRLSDMIDQMRQAEKMGGLDKISDTLPHHLQKKIQAAKVDPKIFKRMEAIYLSMTEFERRNPHMIKGPHKVRIAKGSGVEVQQVNQLLSQHSQANKLMKRAAKNPAAAMNLMRGMFR